MDEASDGQWSSGEDDVLAVVRRRIHELRTREGLSQAEAARRAGLTQSAWSRLETGDAELRLALLLRVQRALGVPTLESLLGQLPSERLAHAMVTSRDS
jgi:transcriptional regulator with XRE-family HTH domain